MQGVILIQDIEKVVGTGKTLFAVSYYDTDADAKSSMLVRGDNERLATQSFEKSIEKTYEEVEAHFTRVGTIS